MLIQVVPRRAAEPNGVTDYAQALARALRDGNGISSVFLSGTSSDPALPDHDEWQTISLAQRKPKILADTIRSLSAEGKARAVLLHFSGYGYQKRGVPFWLSRGLQMWSRSAGRIPLITMFHELYATSRPWHSAFWLSPFQKRIAHDILTLSSAAITPTNLLRQRLSDWRNHDDGKIVTVMPVFSNVGEPGRGASPCERAPTAVVFGLTGVEDRLFGTYRSEVERIVRTLGIKRILDIGPRFSPSPGNLAGVPVVTNGSLPPRAVSELLQNARFGFVAYPVDVLGKSGVFAAYAAHGVVPIVLSEKDRLVSLDDLRPMQHFLDAMQLRQGVGADDLASIQRDLFAWYMSHTLSVQADFLARLMLPGPRHSENSLKLFLDEQTCVEGKRAGDEGSALSLRS